MAFDVGFQISGESFMVIGASSGIGKEITEEILKGGGNVLAIARNEEGLLPLVTEYKDSVCVCAVDARDSSLESVVSEFAETNGKLHGAVYTAGISGVTALRSYDQGKAKEIMDINYWGFVNFAKVVNRKKYSEDGCSSVVISSVAGHHGEAGNFAYSASKAAIINSVKTFAKEIYKRGNRINSISPGFVNTSLSEGFFEERGFSERTKEKHLLGFGQSSDVSGLALYLLSDRARWITGQDFVIDGGYLVSD